MTNFTFEKIQTKDFDGLLSIMKDFYASPAVINKPSEQQLLQNLKACVDPKHNIEGYEIVSDGVIIGYFMLTLSFSTEYACDCLWVEDLYIVEKFRGQGIGHKIFDFIKTNFVSKGYRIRLEVEKDNILAKGFYKKNGLNKSEYEVMEINPK